MQLIKDYMKDAVLRHELNQLTQEVFAFDFENWFMGGYCEGNYIPYSYEENGSLIANVSANRMVFLQNGREKNYIQLGTVMTKAAFRNRGYSAKLMELVLAEYTEKCDGIYLFGNLSALGFYDKMGFSRGIQYRYALKDDIILQLQKKALEKSEADCFCLVNPSDLLRKADYEKTVRFSAVYSALEQKNKYGLQMFYTAEMEQVYYSSALNCYAVMSREGQSLSLHSVIGMEKVPLELVLGHIREGYDGMVLGFAPCAEDAALFVPQLYDGGDEYRLFTYGDEWKSIAGEQLYFPDFSHA